MTSGWGVYYVVFLAAVLGLMFPVFLALVSRLVRARERRRAEMEPAGPFLRAPNVPRASATDLPTVGRRVNTRFFLGANVALTLITLAFILVPCIGALHVDSRETAGPAAVAGIVMVAVLSSVALLYASRKGDLDWLRSYRPLKDEGES
jgi:NADH:ubiquinone oxidoreductase subunit 3 (subunit A)